MKWMLLVVVFGTAPVKTELLFDTLDECLRAEDRMRRSYSTAFNEWHKWARENPGESGFGDTAFEETRTFMPKRFGLRSPGTCIPHSGLPK
jgi:hypothetical protein